MNFEDENLNVLLNPRIGRDKELVIQKLIYKNLNKELAGHILVASSGSTQKECEGFKLIALSKKAILISAQAVNKHLSTSKKDVWLNCLPVFHVGGLGIHARAFLTGSQVVILEKWEPAFFCSLIESHFVTLTSLVPAQVYDLCKQKLKAPKTIRGVIVGGGALNHEIYLEAQKLGWPLLPSYGLTECASQVATSDNNSPDLHLLSHIEARINAGGFLEIRSEALLTCEVLISKDIVIMQDPKKEGWFTTEDLVALDERQFIFKGRAQDFIKIGGEGVLFSSLQQKLEEIRLSLDIKDDAVLIVCSDERLGNVIHLAATAECKKLVETFNVSCMPYERIRHVHYVSHIPRSPLKKLLLHELRQLITVK
ncbi:MAG TPA: AMP-binding protein [Parachlamydiaceae bacterium]|nr:AMP-binding protein [Parachlamydiaceae bacterium]